MIFFVQYIAALVLLVVAPLPALASDVPHEIAGIELGTSVEEYPDFELSNYLKETVIVDWHGFRKGVISYGICSAPGIIVKLQMKYEDSSKQFYDVLMRRFTEKYGRPSKWEGDSFGINQVWKWRFVDKEGRKVNMILQHNMQDVDENIGNQVKLYYPEMIEEERLCFIELCKEISDPEQQARKEKLKESGWTFLIPQ